MSNIQNNYHLTTQSVNAQNQHQDCEVKVERNHNRAMKQHCCYWIDFKTSSLSKMQSCIVQAGGLAGLS